MLGFKRKQVSRAAVIIGHLDFDETRFGSSVVVRDRQTI